MLTTSFVPYFLYFILFITFSNIKTLAESEEEFNQDSKDEIQEAISWYNRILGFHIEGGHGNRRHLIVQHFFVYLYVENDLQPSVIRGKIHIQEHLFKKSKSGVLFHCPPCK